MNKFTVIALLILLTISIFAGSTAASENTHDSFIIDEINPEEMYRNLKYYNKTQDNGYPWPDDHWSDDFHIAELELINKDVPRFVKINNKINVSYEVRIDEDYPEDITSNLTSEDNYTASVKLVSPKYNLVLADKKPKLENSTLKTCFDTSGLVTGSYYVKFNGSIPAQIDCTTSNLTVNVVEEKENFNVNDFVITPENITLEGDLNVCATIENTGETNTTVKIMINNRSVDKYELDKGESIEINRTYSLDKLGFDKAGKYSIYLNATDGNNKIEALHSMITVKEPNDTAEGDFGFLYVIFILGLLAVVLYRTKHRVQRSG